MDILRPRDSHHPTPSFAVPPPTPHARSPHRATTKRPLLKTIGALAFVIFLLGIVWTVFIGWKSFTVSRSIHLEQTANPSFLAEFTSFAHSFLEEERKPLTGETSGRVNILLLGRAGESYPGRNLTDTIMLVSLDTKNKKVGLLSLPRDLYAPVLETGFSTKLNSLYQYGISRGEDERYIRSAVEHITGQDIHYFLSLDFDGFEKVVDALGGISVDVVKDFYDPRYPGKNYSYETFEIKKGWQVLDGKTALKYVRERHDDPKGDFGRAKRQQQVLQAIKDKAFSAGTLFNFFTVNNLMDALGESVRTDIGADDIRGFLALSRTIDTKNITPIVIDAWKKESLLRVDHVQVGPVRAFILVPRVGNWNEIREVSDNIFRLETLKERQIRIKNEHTALEIRYTPKNLLVAQKLSRLIRDDMELGAVSLHPLSAFENQPEQSMIVDRTRLAKPYSLDELIKKFSLVQADVSNIETENHEIDFVLTVGRNMTETLSFDENADPDSIINSDFSEELPPQPKK